MLQEENRLKKLRDFNLLMKCGRWANGRLVDVKFVELAKFTECFPKKEDPAKYTGQLKFAFTVGVKLDKRAVVRNRLRRQMREVVRLLIKENKLKSGYFLLLVAKKDVIGKEYSEIEKDLQSVLVKIGIV